MADHLKSDNRKLSLKQLNGKNTDVSSKIPPANPDTTPGVGNDTPLANKNTDKHTDFYS